VDLREIIKAAREQGWDVSCTRKGHWRFLPPDTTQEPIIASGTSGDVRSVHHLLARLRRAGLIWPWPQRM